jgi:hypothetical protein
VRSCGIGSKVGHRGIILFLIGLILSLTINAQDTASAEDSEETILCKVGIYIKTIRINQAEENFEVLFYWWLRVDSIDVDFDYSVIEDIEFINADAETDIDVTTIDTLNRYYFVAGRCFGTIPYKADYRQFPFDTQSLIIALENRSYNQDVIRYVPDDLTNNINRVEENNVEFLNGDQYVLHKMQADESKYVYMTNFGDPAIEGNDTYSRVQFVIGVDRNPMGIIQKIALPLLVVLILSYLVFFIPDYEIGTASGLTVTALLAAIAFQWTLNDSLPKVSYLTLIDRIFYLVYFYIFYAMAQTVLTFNMSKGDERMQSFSERIEWHSRYLFPLSFALIILLIIY